MAEQIKRARSVTLERNAINEEARTVRVAFSSNAEVDRGGFIEILSHERGAMDTHRLEDGAAVLVDHEWTDQVGVVESIEIDSIKGVGRALLRFGKSQRANEIFRDVVEGIRKHISFGYIVHEEQKLEGRRGVLVTKYEPYEISLVSVPADVTVGVGRANTEFKESQEMDNNELLQAERERIAKIRKLGEKFSFIEQAERAIEDGTSVQDFVFLIGEQSPNVGATDSTQPTGSIAAQAGITERDLSKYSVAKVLRAIESKNWEDAGFELDVSNAIQGQKSKIGMRTDERNFTLPHEALQRGLVKRAQTTVNSTEITPTDYRPDLFQDFLREKSLVGQLGARILTKLSGSKAVEIPSQISDPNPKWIGEGMDSPEDQLTFKTTTVSPDTLSVSIPVTRQLRNQSDPQIDALVGRSILHAMAAGLDIATFFSSRGAKDSGVDGGEWNPDGIFSSNRTIGSHTITDTKNGFLTWSEIVQMEAALNESLYESSSIRMLTSRVIRANMKEVVKVANAPDLGFILDSGDKVNNHPLIAHNMFADTKQTLLGDFTQAVWGLWTSIDLRMDTSTFASSDGLVIRAFQDAGFNLINNDAFIATPKIAAA
ncbi:phage major capsid protein [Vibrio parahaemolyticus]|uniref:phage major capsid protein n=1 Tax=Vibrio parahaemolyticus TaxID=670 RepID=UPI00165527C8|nr:phage major capsid protein [Vibrio parahaemolyticus]MBC8662057.1 phage major capsid protein [Vibrio parahaemolyticus]